MLSFLPVRKVLPVALDITLRIRGKKENKKRAPDYNVSDFPEPREDTR